jgi:hypothetical protein
VFFGAAGLPGKGAEKQTACHSGEGDGLFCLWDEGLLFLPRSF